MANKYTDRELLDFNYTQSDKVNLAEQQKKAAEQALKDYGGYNFNYGRQADYDKAMDAILNRKKFSYDLNGDMLYQQYKDNYINHGKLAMMDTMGQAAAMTGGYGNSYAATVGNQAYQASLQNLNNIIPDLYSLALQSYNAEGDRLATNLNALGSDRQLAQSEYDTKYNADMSRLIADRDYHTTNYNNERSFDYGSQYDAVNANNEAYWNEYNAGYQAEQDAIANALNERQMAISEANLKINQEAQRIAELQAGVVRDSSGNIVSVGSTGEADSDFERYTYARDDDDDNSVFYRDGKEYTVAKGVNPYTGTKNNDIENGVFGNGYQPDNIGGEKLQKTGLRDYVNGVEQNVWQTDDGTMYIWDGTKNRYLKYVK